MQAPRGLGMGPDSSIWVYDARKRAMVQFDLGGAPLGERRVAAHVRERKRFILEAQGGLFSHSELWNGCLARIDPVKRTIVVLEAAVA